MTEHAWGVGGGRSPLPALIDAHAHLTDARLAGEIDGVIARAAGAGVVRILTCGEDAGSSEAGIALAGRSPAVRAAVGIHPHRATTCDDAALRRVRELAADPHVVAIGEIGIDLSGRSASCADQERAFVAQLRLAAELGLPACLHVRDAGDVTRHLVDTVRGVRGYVHCYSEGPEEVDEWSRRGFAISFAGTVTFPANDRLRAAAAAVPADRILIETDAPYLAPQPHRGKRNEPALIEATYAAVAAARGVTTALLARTVSENARALFGGGW